MVQYTQCLALDALAMAKVATEAGGGQMIPFILAVLLAFPVPPMGATLGEGTPAPVPYHSDVASVAIRTTLPATGLATYYSAGLFERVVRNQISYGDIQPDACPDCDGYAAMLWPGDMGRVVCVEGLRLWIVDVAAGHHRPGLIARDWVIDIDRETWLHLGWQDAPTLTTVNDC